MPVHRDLTAEAYAKAMLSLLKPTIIFSDRYTEPVPLNWIQSLWYKLTKRKPPRRLRREVRARFDNPEGTMMFRRPTQYVVGSDPQPLGDRDE